MGKSFEIELIAGQEIPHVRLDVSHGSGHIVVELDNAKVIETMLAFIAEHQKDTAANWIEIGRFASCPVSLCLTHNHIVLIIDSNLPVDNFAQSCGLHVPRGQLDQFVSALAEAYKQFLEKHK